METVICYLLFVPQKIRFWKLSTVTLGIDDIDLFSCFIPLFHGCLISKS